ncbi:hypothetical protein D7O18_15060 [Salmonella enterica subsp. enterica serovar Muenchen]|nr:hypothetical protein [Salmonella enterica subsp. enterica serovar Muenchen]
MMVEDVLKALKWFDVEKYDTYVKQLSYAQWLDVLWERCEFWKYNIDAPLPSSRVFEFVKDKIIEARKMKNKRLAIFIEKLFNSEILSEEWLNNEESMRNISDLYPGAHRVLASDLQYLAYINSIDGMSSTEYMDKVYDCDPRYYDVSTQRFIDFELKDRHDSHELIISMDLDGSDDFLIKRVKEIISKERKRTNVKPSRYLNDALIRKFIDLRLLQYLDVCIYCDVKKLNVNNTLLAKILYPDEFEKNPIERIRKTMPEIAEYVMSEKFLYASEYRLARG